MNSLRKTAAFRNILLLILLNFSFVTFKAYSGEKNKATLQRESFLGSVCYIEYDSPGLDFVIMTQERPGQEYLLDDIQNQPFEFIWVHREFKSRNNDALKEIREYLLEGYESGRSKVVISGEYSTEMAKTMGRSDGYLQLISINIFGTDRRFNLSKSYHLDGVVGGVIGCGCPPKKKKKNNYDVPLIIFCN